MTYIIENERQFINYSQNLSSSALLMYRKVINKKLV